MATQSHQAVVGVFRDRSKAQLAVNELRQRGFKESQIGVVGPGADEHKMVPTANAADSSDENYAGEGAVAGLATGAGVGALWGLGILAGVLPAIGPAIAGGTLAAILSSTAAGAAAAGLGGALVGLGMSKDEADYYESEFKSGRTVVTVSAGGREDDAETILRSFGAYNISNRDAATRSESFHASTGAPTARASVVDRHRGEDYLTAYEEELKVEKSAVEMGNVNVHKEVHTEHKTIDVPVQREEVVIERRPASGHASDQQQIHIPVREEQVRVEKEMVAKEDVVVSKHTVQDTQHIDETLRKEEIKVDGDTSARVVDRRRKD